MPKKKVQSEELSTRQRNLLFAIVKEYCDNNIAIGSKELREKYGFDFSPATIRNELVKLRTMGYLYQPFTNSGSQPTEKSFKLFISKLIDGLHITSKQQSKMKERILELQDKQTKMSKEIAKLLAVQSGGVAFSLSQDSENYTGISNLLKAPGEGKIDDILNFLDNIDDYKQFLLPGHVDDVLDIDELTKKNKLSIRTIIGDENPVIPLGKGYAMVTTEVYFENGEKSVVGLITPVQLLAKKKNLQLLESLNKALGEDGC